MKNEISCLACGSFENLKICPRCTLAYCCVKCFRSELHCKCSEAFYRECVEQELRSRKNGVSKPHKTFEEIMQEHFRGETPTDFDGLETSSQEMLDSDDEEEDGYLEKVEDGCILEYETAEEQELDRQLTLLGIGTDNEKLLSSLTDVERKSFTLLYEKLLEEEGVGRSVFLSKQGTK